MSIRPHAFVAMPFGCKPGPDGDAIDFDRVHRELILPAVEAAGFTVLRADGELTAGTILADMFQELLLADLVVADLTIANPNVWYEVGVRHALRARGVVLLFGGRSPSAFDLYTERKARYRLAGAGPDPATLAQDRAALTAMVQATMASDASHRVSPVYQHLSFLQEPDWTSLRVGRAQAYWQAHDAWQDRLDRARAQGEIGDVLVLAEEAPVAAFRAEAWVQAGRALRRAGEYTLALASLERALAVQPDHLPGLREQGVCLQRLALAGAPGHSLARARQHDLRLLERHPRDAETRALLARLDKDAWTAAWRALPADQARARAVQEEVLLEAAAQGYEAAFRLDPRHFYAGLNALTLMLLADHLGLQPALRHRPEVLAGAVRFAAENTEGPGEVYWALASLAELAVLQGTPTEAARATRRALALPGVSRFEAQSTQAQWQLLQALGFRAEAVTAGLDVIAAWLAALDPPEGRWQPRKVVLFSGHRVDAPDRASPRFPLSAVARVTEAIEAALDGLQAGPDDLALCQAAAGGDLIFLEACQRRGLRARVLLPFERGPFLERSVLPSDGAADWRARFERALAAPRTSVRILPVELGPAPAGSDPFERCNRWQLYTGLALGLPKLNLIALWNGNAGDGPGGTAHMVAEARRVGGVVHAIPIPSPTA